MVNRGRFVDLLVVAGVLFLMGPARIPAAPMGTAFTYQGRFNDAGSPANGAYDFEFKLYDAATAGTQVGSTVTKGDLTVTDGYFTTTLDFGAGRFAGDARWLQIAVRPGAQTGAYTTLTPRHELTPIPYALYSDNEGTANYIPKFISTGMVNSALYDSGGNIGIGTTSPGTDLDVQGGQDSQIRTYGSRNPYLSAMSTDGNVFTKLQSCGTASYGLVGTDSNHAFAIYTNNLNRMHFDTAGNVGVDTMAPVQKLDVYGTIRCISVIQTSDEQLKTNIQPLSGVLGKLDQVRAVSFEWNEKAEGLGATAGTKQIGVLAQEIEQVFPELVTTPTPITADQLSQGYTQEMLTAEVRQRLQRDAEATHYKAVNYSQLTAVLLEAVKELQAENQSLAQRIQALESKVP